MPGDELNCEGDVLTLLCDDHHRLIDRGDVAGLPEESLLAVKDEHEIPIVSSIELATEVTPDMQSEILFYGANSGCHLRMVTVRECAEAMAPYAPRWRAP